MFNIICTNTESSWNPNSNTLEPDRPRLRLRRRLPHRPTIFVLLCFLPRKKKKNRRTFQKCYFYFFILSKLYKSETGQVGDSLYIFSPQTPTQTQKLSKNSVILRYRFTILPVLECPRKNWTCSILRYAPRGAHYSSPFNQKLYMSHEVRKELFPILDKIHYNKSNMSYSMKRQTVHGI